MDKKDKELILKIAKRLGAIEKKLKEKDSKSKEFLNKEKTITNSGSLTIEYYAEISEQEKQMFIRQYKNMMLKTMKMFGIKRLIADIQQD